jgi:hypothetical protein
MPYAASLPEDWSSPAKAERKSETRVRKGSETNRGESEGFLKTIRRASSFINLAPQLDSAASERRPGKSGERCRHALLWLIRTRLAGRSGFASESAFAAIFALSIALISRTQLSSREFPSRSDAHRTA